MYFPPEQADPGPNATPEQWAAYYAQMWPAFTARAQTAAAADLAAYHAGMLALRQREVAAVEEARAVTIAHMQFEKDHAERKLVANMAEARATDRTASGAIDMAKVLKDVRGLLAVTKQVLEAQPPPTPPPPGLSG